MFEGSEIAAKRMTKPLHKKVASNHDNGRQVKPRQNCCFFIRCHDLAKLFLLRVFFGPPHCETFAHCTLLSRFTKKGKVHIRHLETHGAGVAHAVSPTNALGYVLKWGSRVGRPGEPTFWLRRKPNRNKLMSPS